MSGRLEIGQAPDLWFDRARQPMPLRIGHVRFTDRRIASGVLAC